MFVEFVLQMLYVVKEGGGNFKVQYIYDVIIEVVQLMKEVVDDIMVMLNEVVSEVGLVGGMVDVIVEVMSKLDEGIFLELKGIFVDYQIIVVKYFKVIVVIVQEMMIKLVINLEELGGLVL